MAVTVDVDTGGTFTDGFFARIYKVVFDPDTLTVDEEATVAARNAERADRLARSRPTPEFLEQWLTKRPPEEILSYYGSWPEGGPLESMTASS